MKYGLKCQNVYFRVNASRAPRAYILSLCSLNTGLAEGGGAERGLDRVSCATFPKVIFRFFQLFYFLQRLWLKKRVTVSCFLVNVVAKLRWI